MTEPHLDFSDVRSASHKLAEQRREARRDYVRYCKEAADADRDYRKAKAIKFAECKSQGMSVAQAELEADAGTADDRHKRAIADSMAKACLLRIEELERDQATLRSLGDWSQRIDGNVQPSWSERQ